MMDAPNLVDGWLLRDAVARLVSPKIIGPWENNKRTLESLSSYADATEVKKAVHIDEQKVLAALKNMGSQGKIIAWGCPNTPQAEPQQIAIHRWVGFEGINYKSSNIYNTPSIGFCSVRIFPILEAPNANELISEHTLSDILREFVAHDPEIRNLRGEEVDHDEATLSDIIGQREEGSSLVPITDRRTIEQALSTFPPLQDDTRKLTSLGKVIASRLSALGKVLTSGKLVAHAFRASDQHESVMSIAANDLRKPSTRLCLETGDIWREQDSKPQRLFYNVWVKTPEAPLERVPAWVGTEEAVSNSKNSGGRPLNPEIKAAFDVVLKREFETVGHGFESAAAFARGVTEMWMRQKSISSLPDDELFKKNEAITTWIRDNFPALWELLKNGVRDA